MGFWKTVLGIARRRFVGPPLILLSLGLAVFAYFLAPTHYVSSGYMVLTAPAAGGVVDPSKPAWSTNPLLQFNDGLKTTAGILIQAMNTPDVDAALGAPEGGPTTLTVNDGSTNPALTSSTTGPFIYVQVDGTSPVGVRELVLLAENRMRDDLAGRQLQLQAPKSTYLLLTDVVPPAAPVVTRTVKWEAAGGVLIGALVLGFGAAYAGGRLRDSSKRAASVSPRVGGSAGRPVSSGRPAYALTYDPMFDPFGPGSASDPGSRVDLRPGATAREVGPGPAQVPESAEYRPGLFTDPVPEPDETSEFAIVFDDDDAGGADEVKEQRVRADEVKEQRVRPFKVLRASDELKAGARHPGDAGDNGDGAAAPRAG
jgi:hypothetical protein